MKKQESNIVLALRAVFERNKTKAPETVKTEMAERYMLETEAADQQQEAPVETKVKKSKKRTGATVEKKVDQYYARFVKEDDVIKYMANGHDVKATAFSFGITPAAVYAIIKTAKEFGVELPNIAVGTRKAGVSAYKAEIERDIREGILSNQAIAAKYGVKFGNVSQFRQKLCKEDLNRQGYTDIKTGRATMSEEERKAASERRNVSNTEKRKTVEAIAANDENVVEEVRGWACLQINSGLSFDTIINKASKKGGLYGVLVCEGYLEQLKYGALLNTIIDQHDTPEINYTFDGIDLAYEYFDASMPRPVIRKRIITKEIAQMFFDANKKFKTIIEEGVLSNINHYLRTGDMEPMGSNTTLRVIGLPKEQQELMYNIAFS